MRKILLLAVAGLFCASAAHADFTGKDASAATITFKNPNTCSSVVCVPVFQIYDGTNVVTLTTAGADGVSNTLTGQPVYGRMLQFNGTTWDRWQGAIKAASGAFAAGSLVAGAGADGWDVTEGTKADAKNAATDTTPVSVVSILKQVSASIQSAAASLVSLLSPNTAAVTNPTSTLTLPSTTTAYSAGTLICTSATVATCNTGVAASTLSITNSAGAANISRLRLTTNDSTATAWSAAQIQVDLWIAAPTFQTTGDRGVFNTDFLTGSAGHLGAFTCIMSAELADGAFSECFPVVGNGVQVKLASGTSIFYTLQAVNGSGVTGASKIFTLTAELQN